MSFFDDKEEVLNIELTQTGKYLLSHGKFQPKYYAFFDDSILYDSFYTGLSESQNSSQDRILDETPSIKPQGNYSGVEIRRNELNDVINSSNIKVFNELGVSKNTEPYKLGTSDYNSNYIPSWNIKMLSGHISSCSESDVKTNNPNPEYSFLKIPQINLENPNFNLYIRQDRDLNVNENVYLTIPEDSLSVCFTDRNLLNVIEVVEQNCQDNIKNFNIEFFIEEGDSWKPLKFFKELNNIKDDILLDEYENKDVMTAPIDENSVEYYFEVLMDSKVVLPEVEKQTVPYTSNIDDQFKPFGDKC